MSLLAALLDLVLPAECAACRAPGTRWCDRCARALQLRALPPPAPAAATVRSVAPASSAPPTVVHAWGLFEEPLRRLVTAWKDEDRRDVTPVLAGPLSLALDRAVSSVLADTVGGRAHEPPPVLVVPVPSSPRSLRHRGDWPMLELARQSTVAWGAHASGRAGRVRLVVCPALRVRRTMSDQSGLSRLQRRVNVAGAFEVRPRWRSAVAGLPAVVLDDVMTTGSTVTEAVRALSGAGCPAVAAAVVARVENTGPN